MLLVTAVNFKTNKIQIHAEILKKYVIRRAFEIHESAKSVLKIRNQISFLSQIHRSAHLFNPLGQGQRRQEWLKPPSPQFGAKNKKIK